MSHAKLTTRFFRERARNGRQATFRARVPSGVKDYLEARDDDEIVFEPGDEHSHTLAALRGRYMIVRVNRPCAADRCTRAGTGEAEATGQTDDNLTTLVEKARGTR